MTANEVNEVTTAERPRDDGQVTKDRESAEVEQSGPKSDEDDRQPPNDDGQKSGRWAKHKGGVSKRSLEGPRSIYIKAPKARRAITSRPAANRSRSANKQVETQNVVHMRRGTRTRSPGQRDLGAGQANRETGAEPGRGAGAQNVDRGRGSRLPFANFDGLIWNREQWEIGRWWPITDVEDDPAPTS